MKKGIFVGVTAFAALLSSASLFATQLLSIAEHDPALIGPIVDGSGISPKLSASTDFSWNVVGGGSWSLNTNWTPSSPAGGPDAPGLFVVVNTNIASNQVITLFNNLDAGDATKTIGRLDIGDVNGGHNFTIAAGSASGVLNFDGNGANAQLNQLATSANNTISAPVTLTTSLDVTNASPGTLIISGDVSAATAGTKTITTSTGAVSISGAISDGSGAVAVTQNGPGQLTLLGANTYTGATTINGGSVQLGNGTNVGSLSPNSTISIGAGASLIFNHNNNAPFVQGTNFSSAGITGAGSIVKEGVSSLTFNVVNNFSGGLVINKGTVTGTVDGALGTGNISITAGNITLFLNGASNNIADSATLSILNTDSIVLNNTSTDTVAGLIVDGVAQAPGVYGSTALNPDGAFFGAGTITVVPEPTTWGMLLLGGGLLTAVRRFRRKHM